MQSRLDPNAPDSIQFSFDGSLRALQFVGNFSFRGSLKFKQHDRLHRFIGNRIEQLLATFGDFRQHIRRLLFATDRVDPSFPEA